MTKHGYRHMLYYEMLYFYHHCPSCFLFCLCQEHTISLYLWVLGVSFYSCITLSSCPCELISQVRRLIRMTVLIGYQKNRKTFICVVCNMNTLRTYYRAHLVSITSLILHQNKGNPLLYNLSAGKKFAFQICEVRIHMNALSTKYKTQCRLHYKYVCNAIYC